MHINIFRKYYFINKFETNNIDKQDNQTVIIYRNYSEKKIDKLLILKIKNYCKKKKISVEGPLPADSAFIKNNQNKYDIFICMFHDQALIPVKMISFDETVNYTAGLSFVRTSPDHGTGLDIAKKFIASPNSLIAALKSASKIAQARRK